MGDVTYSLPFLDSDSGLRMYLKEVQKIPTLSEDDEKSLAQAWLKEGDMKAGHKLVISHLRLVVKVAFRFFRSYGLPMIDLISEGNIGLIKAVQKFDPSMGCRLATYATWWIKASIQDFILRSWSMVKVSTSLVKKRLFGNFEKIKNKIFQISSASASAATLDALPTGGNQIQHSDALLPGDCSVTPVSSICLESPSLPQVANRSQSKHISEISRDAVHAGYVHNLLSLDHSYSDEDDAVVLGDRMQSDDMSQEDAIISQQERVFRNAAFVKALARLSDREKDILAQRYLKKKPATLEQLSSIYNVSRERIRQIEQHAINKIRSVVTAEQQCLV